MVKDYDCEILYNLGKANVVADALSRRAESAPIRDLCMRLTVMTPVLDTIRGAQAEAMRLENRRGSGLSGRYRSSSVTPKFPKTKFSFN